MAMDGGQPFALLIMHALLLAPKMAGKGASNNVSTLPNKLVMLPSFLLQSSHKPSKVLLRCFDHDQLLDPLAGHLGQDTIHGLTLLLNC